MRRTEVRLATIWMAGLLTAAPASALADGADSLAPPGPCAELRQALRPPPVDGERFDVAGGPARHFDPTDVAADDGDPTVLDDVVKPPGFARSPCDAPDAGCLGALSPRGLQEGPADPSLPPGAGRQP